MKISPQQYFDILKTKKVALIGLGVSHKDLIFMLKEKGVDVTLLDKSTSTELGEIYSKLKSAGIKCVLGKEYMESLTDYDVIFRSPGVYYNKPELCNARESGVVITSEIESFFELCPCKIYAVTGSDGKTTTTTLISEMLMKQGYNVHMGGNIGRALLPIIEQIKPDDMCVVELSSFQLISMTNSPDVAVITNISPNHLDVHTNMDEYIGAKMQLLAHQGAFAKAVLNLDDEHSNILKKNVRGRFAGFSRKYMSPEGAYLDGDGYLIRVVRGIEEKLFHMDEIKLPGIHNVENYLASISAVSKSVSAENLHEVAKTFAGVEHRIEYVSEIDGVSYYNDSIATSPTRTIAGLRSFNKKIVVIAGGYDKNIPYEPLAPVLDECCKLLILLGATAPKIKKAVKDINSDVEIIEVETLEQAVQIAVEKSVHGDVVSLSPASASFDLYKNFEERGEHFKSIVRGIEVKNGNKKNT